MNGTTSLPQIDHIVFDVGHVLLHWDPEIPYRDLIADETRRRWFLSEVCSPEWNFEQDRGRSWTAAEAELIARFPAEETLIRAFRKRWLEMIPHALDESVAILEGLVTEGRDVTLLTNFNDETFAEARARYPFLDLARGATVSALVGLLKPEREIFDHHAQTFGLDAGATLFIDDSPVNVDGARAAGWHAVQFHDPARLRADLADFGIAA
jgi:2-haloacid dehalogenase